MKARFISLFILLFLAAPLSAATDKVFSEDLYKEAMERFNAGDFKKSHRLLKALYEKYPDHPVVLNGLGVVSQKLGNFQLAERFFERAIELNRAAAVSYRNLQNMYNHRAAETYREALALDSDPPPAPQLKFIMPSAKPAELAHVPASERVLKDKQIEKSLVEEPARADSEVSDAREKEIIRFVESWAKAWSKQDEGAYFSHYTDGYQPRLAITNAKWKKSRTSRLRSPQFISVKVSKVRVQEDGDDYEVVFRQAYESNLLRSVVTKRFRVRKTDAGWKIAEERVVKR